MHLGIVVARVSSQLRDARVCRTSGKGGLGFREFGRKKAGPVTRATSSSV